VVTATATASIEDIRHAAGSVPEPEMPAVTLEMLGIVHAVEVDDGDVVIDLLPTFVGCPAIDIMAEDVRAAVTPLPGVTSVQVRFRHAPAWTTDRITQEGRAALASFGIAPPVGRGTLPMLVSSDSTRLCPWCGSADTERDGLFGPTPCRDVRFCRACQQPFEAFKTL
jgi:ring-1,2-phenylacetyl-CoA epoxidase subunit PaaD